MLDFVGWIFQVYVQSTRSWFLFLGFPALGTEFRLRKLDWEGKRREWKEAGKTDYEDCEGLSFFLVRSRRQACHRSIARRALGKERDHSQSTVALISGLERS